MNKIITEKSKHKSSDIRYRLENDIEFRQTIDRTIAGILDEPVGNDNGSAKGHTLKFSGQLLKPHIDNLKIGIIDSYEAGNLRCFLVFHNGLRRMFEIGIETVHNDTIEERMKDFGQRRQRFEAM